MAIVLLIKIDRISYLQVMTKYYHCTLCENQNFSFDKGITCKLTGKKPDFVDTCPDIQLEQEFKEKITLSSFELEKLRRLKGSVYSKFYISIAIGFSLIIGSGKIARFIRPYDSDMFLYTWIGSVGLGLLTLSKAFLIYNRFEESYKSSLRIKKIIDDVLLKYDIKYIVKFEESNGDLDFEKPNITLEQV